MGGCDWEESGWIIRTPGSIYTRKDLSSLFDDLKEDAEAEHGHEEGYSGEINMKDSFNVCGVMTRKQFNSVSSNKWNWLNNSKKNPPKIITDQGVRRYWEEAEGKRNDACVVIIKDETRDTTVVSGAFIKDKGIIPALKREKKKYVINYTESSGWNEYPQSKRVATVPEAWKWIKVKLNSNPKTQIQSIENAYTYAQPKVGKRTKKAKQVFTEWWGTSPC